MALKLLMAEPVEIDSKKCGLLADLLKRCAIPQPIEEGTLEGITAWQLPNFYFVLVAVCHQTSPAGRPRLSGTLSSGEVSSGWDYLRKRFAERIKGDQTLLDPHRWRKIAANELEEVFADTAGVKTLIGVERRAELIRDIGERYEKLGITDISDLYRQCEGWLVGGLKGGLYAALSQFAAYVDPVRKKSSFFLELMRGQCGWQYRDPQNLGAPVDYHEVRGHLRIGTVVLTELSLKEKILRGESVNAREDEVIRNAVHDAIALISQAHGSCDPATLHYLFWNTFRNCCAREYQHCLQCTSSCTLPQRYREAFKAVENDRCVFATICNSVGKTDKLIEHRHETDYY